MHINELAENLINFIQNENNSKEDAMNKFNLSSEDYDKYFNYIYGDFFISDDSKKALNRLVIHVTNDCNLRCQYCYANGGNYESDRTIMSYETLDKIIEYFFSEYEYIGGIQFFGGEPLLNAPLIDYACEKIENISPNTRFSIVTNGTLVTDEIISMINRYNIIVTLSYDGYVINDIMRIFPDGSGTSEKILKNGKRLLNETKSLTTIEATYTKHHVYANYSVIDVIKQIQAEFPGVSVHLVPAGGSDDCDFTVEDLSIFTDSIKDIVNMILSSNQPVDMNDETLPLYSLAARSFLAISNPNMNNTTICDAGVGTLSISVPGDIYTCFMFTDQEDMRVGNIFDENPVTSEKAKSLFNKIHLFTDKESNPECKSCFIKKVCTGCIGLNSFTSGNPFILDPKLCKMNQSMLEESIYQTILLQDYEKTKA